MNYFGDTWVFVSPVPGDQAIFVYSFYPLSCLTICAVKWLSSMLPNWRCLCIWIDFLLIRHVSSPFYLEHDVTLTFCCYCYCCLPGLSQCFAGWGYLEFGYSNTRSSLHYVTNAVGVKADIPVSSLGDFILKVGGMSFIYWGDGQKKCECYSEQELFRNLWNSH